MPVKILCPNPDCGASYSVADENIGRVGRCKHCGTRFPLVPPTEDGRPGPSMTEVDPAPKAAEPRLPESIGRYAILRLLGRGGMGSVYLARDTHLDRQVALKVPHVHAFGERPEIRQRFFREARASARFRHPNFCQIYDIGEADGIPYLTMDFIEGQTLSRSIDRGQGWAPERAVEVVVELAEALAEAHAQGIVHRDLKPDNVMVRPRGGLVLMDFGLARWYDEDDEISTTGAILGTPAYMPPEQAEGNSKAISPRSDIYSLGVILYELLTGRRPFEGSKMRILGMIAFVEPRPPSIHRPDLDPGLEAICLKAMAKKPEDRFPSMDELARALQAWRDAPRSTAPAPTPTPAPARIETPPIPEPARTETVSTTGRASLEPRVTNSIGMELRLIPAGEFEMGSDDEDPDAEADEKPRHKVRITRPFYLGATEVTVGQFRRFVEDLGYRTEAERDGRGGFGWDQARATFVQDPRYTWMSPGFPQTDDHPAVIVSWNDAMEFCAWLGRKEGAAYRLPTEAEWEYAARAGTTTHYWTGDDPEALATAGNVADEALRGRYPIMNTIHANDGHVFTAPVGQYRPNPWGLLDMHGNVWEWCLDWYDPAYYANSPTEDPTGPTQPATGRVFRGGSWFDDPRVARAAFRDRRSPENRDSDLGFRVVRVPI